MNVVHEILAIALSAAPWLLVGLLAAGLVHALIPASALRRWVGGHGFRGVARAAVIGAPLPLCSCGAIPTALTLYRNGAGRGPSVAFLIGTPGIGVDSVIITQALLGPFMMVARALGAVVSAITTGLLVARTGHSVPAPTPATAASCGNGGCCSENDTEVADPPAAKGMGARLREGIVYGFTDLLDDISTWMLAGLLVAGVLIALVPPQALATYGSGLLPMLLMAVVGIPIYVCATAATPVAAGMLIAGVSPGTVLVFLLAGPMTSMVTLGLLRREMGNTALTLYLAGIIASTVALGLLVDVIHVQSGIDIAGQIGAVHELVPAELQWAALVTLVVLAVRPVRRAAGRHLPA